MLSFRKKFSFTSNKAAPVVEDSNEVLMEGLLDKRGGGTSTFGRQSWKKRWWRLTSTMLSYYEDQSSKTPIKSIPILSIVSVHFAPNEDIVSGDASRFHAYIETNKRTWCVASEASDTIMAWIQAVNRAISTSLGGPPPSANGSSHTLAGRAGAATTSTTASTSQQLYQQLRSSGMMSAPCSPQTSPEASPDVSPVVARRRPSALRSSTLLTPGRSHAANPNPNPDAGVQPLNLAAVAAAITAADRSQQRPSPPTPSQLASNDKAGTSNKPSTPRALTRRVSSGTKSILSRSISSPRLSIGPTDGNSSDSTSSPASFRAKVMIPTTPCRPKKLPSPSPHSPASFELVSAVLRGRGSIHSPTVLDEESTSSDEAEDLLERFADAPTTFPCDDDLVHPHNDTADELEQPRSARSPAPLLTLNHGTSNNTNDLLTIRMHSPSPPLHLAEPNAAPPSTTFRTLLAMRAKSPPAPPVGSDAAAPPSRKVSRRPSLTTNVGELIVTKESPRGKIMVPPTEPTQPRFQPTHRRYHSHGRPMGPDALRHGTHSAGSGHGPTTLPPSSAAPAPKRVVRAALKNSQFDLVL